MKRRQSGQGLVEYALIIVLVAVVAVVIAAVFVPKLFNPPAPPVMDAPLLDIVRWCEGQARDSYTVTVPTYNAVTKQTTVTTQARTRDNPDKFITCMQKYEYRVTR